MFSWWKWVVCEAEGDARGSSNKDKINVGASTSTATVGMEQETVAEEVSWTDTVSYSINSSVDEVDWEHKLCLFKALLAQIIKRVGILSVID